MGKIVSFSILGIGIVVLTVALNSLLWNLL